MDLQCRAQRPARPPCCYAARPFASHGPLLGRHRRASSPQTRAKDLVVQSAGRGELPAETQTCSLVIPSHRPACVRRRSNWMSKTCERQNKTAHNPHRRVPLPGAGSDSGAHARLRSANTVPPLVAADRLNTPLRQRREQAWSESGLFFISHSVAMPDSFIAFIPDRFSDR